MLRHEYGITEAEFLSMPIRDILRYYHDIQSISAHQILQHLTGSRLAYSTDAHSAIEELERLAYGAHSDQDAEPELTHEEWVRVNVARGWMDASRLEVFDDDSEDRVGSP